jgi:hypothetical protein
LRKWGAGKLWFIADVGARKALVAALHAATGVLPWWLAGDIVAAHFVRNMLLI